MHIVIVTGLSGAGKSQALHTLEDQEYYCVDNLPIELLESLFKTERILKQHKIAIGIDVRCGTECINSFPMFAQQLRKKYKIDIIYLHANKDIILKRYDETRRRHPLTTPKQTLQQSIVQEGDLLTPIREISDLQIDTSHISIYELATLIKDRICILADFQLSLIFQSFGFKYGTPSDSDFLFDVRCLPNPYWEPSLRQHSGKENIVETWLDQQPLVQDMKNNLIDLLQKWIPHFIENQRAYLTISIGCTGGHHRSVYLIEKLAEHFQQQERSAIIVSHRELQKISNN
ncbi:MAG TPA: RNase adapter RapZ [Leucothrix mucor]|nr:RNase adapter RapZ [Leucothrix mucor]